jgi:DNA-binding response OmpR family regulator
MLTGGKTKAAMHILFVQDDHEFRDELSDYLAAQGLSVAVFGDFAALAGALSLHTDQLVLLDLAVGGQDGLAFLSSVLRAYGCPCVVLSANTDGADRIAALELGADDFILKNTEPREVLARLRAVIRRSQPVRQDPLVPCWRFLPARRDLKRPDGSSVPLTTAEFNLLAALAQNQGRAMSREELFGAVFNRRFNPLDRAIDNVVAKLRAKLGDPVRGPSMIRTVRPVGYVFTGFPADVGREGA